MDSSAAARDLYRKVKNNKAAVLNLSNFKGSSQKNYDAIVPKTTSASLLASLLENAAKSFQDQDVWELPCVAITSIEPRAKSEEYPISYEGCADCYKKNCTNHSAAGTRPCYSWELSFYDHSASTTMKVFTKHVDELLRVSLSLQTGHRVPDFLAAVKAIRRQRWSVKVIFSFEEAYQANGYTREAHNNLVVVGIKALNADWPGLTRPVLVSLTDSVGPGVPLVTLQDFHVDEARQVFLKDQMVASAEMLVRISGEEPKQEDNEEEKGVRISFEAEDLLASSTTTVRLMWVVPLSESLQIARLQPKTCFLAHVQPRLNLAGDEPHIDCFQVLHTTPCDEGHAASLNARREWQQSADMTGAEKRKGEYSALSPVSRLKAARKEHASPGYNSATKY